MNEHNFAQLGGIEQEGSAIYRHDTPARNTTENDPVSQEYSDLTEGGVEHAKEVARTEILKTIDEAPEGAILFIGGKSDQTRAGQTGEIWGESLKELSQEDRSDLVVLTKDEIDSRRDEIREEHQDGRILEEIIQMTEDNLDKKMVIDYPLFIKELGYGYEDRWTKKNPETGKVEKTDYFSEILKKHKNDHAEAIHDWLENDGVLTTSTGETIQGPRPEDVAKQYLHGLERLYRFTKDKIPAGRPVIVHAVGHQWDLDAVATYLARGRVTYEDWHEVMGRPDSDKEEQVIGEGEGVQNITLSPMTGRMGVKYRGKEFEAWPEPEYKKRIQELNKLEPSELLNKLFEDKEYLLLTFGVGGNFPKLDRREIAARLIKEGEIWRVGMNIHCFPGLGTDTAKLLIDSGYAENVKQYINMFEEDQRDEITSYIESLSSRLIYDKVDPYQP